MIGLSSVLRVVGFGSLMAFAAAGGLRAPSARAVVIDRIVAVVNKDIITLSQVQEAGRGEFSQLQQRYNGRRLKREIERVQRKYLDLLITRRLRVNRAKEMELSFTDAEVDRALEDVKKRNNISDSELEVLLKREGMTIPEYRERVGEEILLRKVMNIEVRSRVSVTPREIKAYYKSHRSEFLPPERIRAGHILFLAPINAGQDIERVKRTAAERVLRGIRKGAGFSEMAKRHSQDPSAARGGDLGIILRGEVLPNFERVLFAMKEGEVSDVVRTRAGFHIIKLVRRLPRIPPPLSQVEKKIRNRIFQEKVTARMRRWMEELKKKAYIEVTM
ncbi:MAG: peptidylprolyl isomerase [Nitrospinota bacterium]|nr:peptidylprolyl isomerase [Nitrospinota bacterium]